MKRFAALLLVVLMVIPLFGCSSSDYKKAVELYDAKDYEGAKEIFDALGDYKDSKDYAFECERAINYNQAVIYYNEKNYVAAKELFDSLGDYMNSGDFNSDCDTYINYDKANELFSSGSYEEAAALFEGLGDYEHSSLRAVDCRFLAALKESVTRRLEMSQKENTDGRSLVSSEYAYLEQYRNVSFFDKEIQKQARKYLSGLDSQKKAFNYEYYYEYQRDWNTGLVARYEALDALYKKNNFMADDNNFVGEYINQLSYYQNWLKAFNALEKTGHTMVKDPKCTYNYVEFYFRNDTEYRSTQVFNLTFWSYDGNTLLDTVSTTVENIQPNQEFTVRVSVPAVAKNGYTVNWDNYYETIFVN